MKMRHLLGIAIFGGLVGALGGPTAQAQQTSQEKFVSMLISQEAKLILKERNSIAQQNFDEQSLTLLVAGNQTAKVRKMIAKLMKSAIKFQGTINALTARLSALDVQTTASVGALPKPNPYTQPASLNTLVIRSFQSRNPFGIPPTTTYQ